MENERGPDINWWMYEDGWRTRGDLTWLENEWDLVDVRGWLENERGPNINWWMYEDGWSTRGDINW